MPSAISLQELERLERSSLKKKTTSSSQPTQNPSTENKLISLDSLGPIRKNKYSSALEAFETEHGGREALVESLELAPLDKKQQYLLNLLTDPRRAKDSINRIAREAGLSPAQAIDIFRSASFARSHAAAMSKMANALPSVIDDITAKSVDAKIECPTCQGDGNLAGDVPCPQCNGKGVVTRYSDLDRQKIVLESTNIIKKGGGVNVNVQQNVGIMNPSSFFTKYVKDSDAAAYDVETIDITPEKPTDE